MIEDVLVILLHGVSHDQGDHDTQKKRNRRLLDPLDQLGDPLQRVLAGERWAKDVCVCVSVC